FGCRVFDLGGWTWRLRAAVGQLALLLLAPARPAEGLDHELHAIALLVLVVAEALEDAQDCFCDAQDLRRRQELVEQPGGLHHDGRAAARGHPEPAPPLPTANT